MMMSPEWAAVVYGAGSGFLGATIGASYFGGKIVQKINNLADDVKEVKNCQKVTDERVIDLGERTAFLEGQHRDRTNGVATDLP